jgi:serine protease AprX
MRVVGIVLSLSVGSAAIVHAQPAASKRDAALQQPPSGLVRVIVTTKSGQTGAVEARLQQRGRAIHKHFSIINSLSAELTADDLAVLDTDPAVASVALDAAVASSAAGGPATPASSSTLLATLGLPVQGLTGKGVGVVVIDSGLDQSGDFSGVTFYDFTSDQPGAPYDDFGHGTHVSGLIASKGSLSQGAYAGIAPKVRLISLKVLDAQGRGATSTVIDAIQFAVANRQSLGADVINLSLGHPILERAATDPLVQAVEAAVRAGIVVVVSAGNVGRNLSTGAPGYAGILSPANAPSAITVGALDSRDTTTRGDDSVAPFSSRGPTWYDALVKPDLVAPGQALVSDAAIGSTLYTLLPQAQVAGNGGVARFLRLNGTSMAAAVTTGVAALMIEAGRSTRGVSPSPATIKALLSYSALPLNGPDALTQGHGALNASGAVALTLALGAAGWQVGSTNAPLAPVTTIGGETWTWGQVYDWGDTVVWGNGDWGDTVVWGNVETVVWGNEETVVWGNLDGWGDTVVWGNTNGVR